MEITDIFALFFAGLDSSVNGLTLYLSVLSGYLAVAYLAGPKLSKSQLYIISSLFVAFETTTTVGIYLIFRVTSTIFDSSDEWNFGPEGYFVMYALTSLLVIGIIGALKFMSDSRKIKKD